MSPIIFNAPPKEMFSRPDKDTGHSYPGKKNFVCIPEGAGEAFFTKKGNLKSEPAQYNKNETVVVLDSSLKSIVESNLVSKDAFVGFVFAVTALPGMILGAGVTIMTGGIIGPVLGVGVGIAGMVAAVEVMKVARDTLGAVRNVETLRAGLVGGGLGLGILGNVAAAAAGAGVGIAGIVVGWTVGCTIGWALRARCFYDQNWTN